MTDELVKTIVGYLPLLIPIVLLQLGLQIFALVDLVKRRTVRYGNKPIWALVIIFGEIFGAIIYLILRGDETE